ncbi:MAG: tRNA (adenosine(37)-N6)-threonylcarbamoyltransferase complex dimerization subunit type 1 TsaB [Bacteroidota bacterium]
MPYLLCIETATPVLSVALYQADRLLAGIEIVHHVGKSHNSLLADAVDEVLKLGTQSLGDLEAVAVSAGPGSYTGLRVGLSFAKGVCLGANLPLIAIDTLGSIIAQGRGSVTGGVCCALLDAKNQNAYGVVVNAQGGVEAEGEKYKVAIATFEKWLAHQKVYFMGDGADRYASHLVGHANSRFMPKLYPRASYMGQLALAKFLAKDFVDIASFEPLYR